jgi:hypothetical protein
MTWPTGQTFVVRDEKIDDYLLDLQHPRGRSKAKYLIGHGFSPDAPERLADALLAHAKPENHVMTTATIWGPRYVFEGTIITPSGTSPRCRSVWQVVRANGPHAALVTIVPL